MLNLVFYPYFELVYVDELNPFYASGEVQNAIVTIQFAKVNMFQGKIPPLKYNF